jgi:hypothetical protein
MSTPSGQKAVANAAAAISNSSPSNCPIDCAKIEAQIASTATEMRARYLAALNDPKDLYNRAWNIPFARRVGSWNGHRQQFLDLQRSLQKSIAAADANGCQVSPMDRTLANAPYPDTPAER